MGVTFCARSAGRLTIELGRPGRSGGLKRVLGRASARVGAGETVSLAPRWTRAAQKRLGRAKPVLRVRFRATGARHELVLSRRLAKTAVRGRAQR